VDTLLCSHNPHLRASGSLRAPALRSPRWDSWWTCTTQHPHRRRHPSWRRLTSSDLSWVDKSVAVTLSLVPPAVATLLCNSAATTSTDGVSWCTGMHQAHLQQGSLQPAPGRLPRPAYCCPLLQQCRPPWRPPPNAALGGCSGEHTCCVLSQHSLTPPGLVHPTWFTQNSSSSSHSCTLPGPTAGRWAAASMLPLGGAPFGTPGGHA